MTLPYLLKGSGEPIVFLHGLGNNKHLWDSQHPLSEKYQLIIPELRGHGENKNDTNITLANLASDVLDLLDSLHIEQSTFCGLSMGGLVALEIYRQAPNRVKSLILSNTTAYCNPWLIHQSKYKKIRVASPENTKAEIIHRCLLTNDTDIVKRIE